MALHLHDGTTEAPWYIIPAGDKENARVIVSQIILETLDELGLSYPEADKAHRKELQSIGKQRTGETKD